MKALWTGFSSVIAEEVQRYLDYKRALARKFRNEEMALRLLDRFLVAEEVRDVSMIDATMIECFLASRARQPARSYNHLLGVIRGFFDWLVMQARLACSPVRALPRKKGDLPQPFLFDPKQAADLLERAMALPDNSRATNRGGSYYLMFALMYALGLRVGEVTRLRLEDVDLKRQLLRINSTKFSKDRLVPFGPAVSQRLDDYLAGARMRGADSSLPSAPVFTFSKGRPVNPCTVSQTFHHLVLDRYVIPQGVSAPHLHCLRHSFAVGTLLRWYRSGVNPNEHLAKLSTFLGHVDPNSTAWYLTITPELLDLANERFERYAPLGTNESIT